MKEYLRKADLLGLAIIAAALMAYSIRSFWTVYQTVAVVFGVIIVLASLAAKSGEIRAGLQRRSTSFGINSISSVFLLIGVLAFLNYLGVQHPKRVDLTTEKIYSLAEQSVQVATQVPQDLHIKVFYPGGDYPPVHELLQLYVSQNKKISMEFIDPDKQPQVAQQYQVTNYGDASNPMTGESLRYGTVIVEMGDRKERIEKQGEPLKEEDVTNALLKVVKGEQKVVYFTEGHGEKQITNTDRSGYQLANEGLAKQSYTVKTLNLVQEGKVPADASVVIMAGPVNEPFPNELDILDAYLKAGGSVYLLLDPVPSAGLKDFTKKWSIDTDNDFIVDASGVGKLFGAGPAMPLVTSYSAQKITQGFNVMTFFPMARSVGGSKPPVEGIAVEQLFASNERSWGETDMKSTQASFDEKADLKGPLPLAMVATRDAGDKKKSRLVVFGDSDFASNQYYGIQGNGSLFTNAVVWLAQDESFLSIRPKNPSDRPLTMTEAQGRMVSYIAVLLLPGSILVAGVSVWMKRRK